MGTVRSLWTVEVRSEPSTVAPGLFSVLPVDAGLDAEVLHACVAAGFGPDFGLMLARDFRLRRKHWNEPKMQLEMSEVSEVSRWLLHPRGSQLPVDLESLPNTVAVR